MHKHELVRSHALLVWLLAMYIKYCVSEVSCISVLHVLVCMILPFLCLLALQ